MTIKDQLVGIGEKYVGAALLFIVACLALVKGLGNSDSIFTSLPWWAYGVAGAASLGLWIYELVCARSDEEPAAAPVRERE